MAKAEEMERCQGDRVLLESKEARTSWAERKEKKKKKAIKAWPEWREDGERKGLWASQVALGVKNLPANAGDIRHTFNPWVGEIPWRRAWHPLQCSCLENPMDRGAWWAAVHGVAKSRTWLKWLSSSSMGPVSCNKSLASFGEMGTTGAWWVEEWCKGLYIFTVYSDCGIVKTVEAERSIRRLRQNNGGEQLRESCGGEALNMFWS